MHFKHAAIPQLHVISIPFAVYKYKMHLFSVLANEPTESRLISWLHAGPKNQLCPELPGGCYARCAAAHYSRLQQQHALLLLSSQQCCSALNVPDSQSLLTCNCTYKSIFFLPICCLM